MKNFYAIYNVDGTPRWMWSKTSKTPHFLKFYSASTIKQKLFKALVEIAFRFKIQGLFFKRTSKIGRDKLPNHDNWSLFFGTPGPNCKRVLFFKDENGKDVFRKIGNGKKSYHKLEAEAGILRDLRPNLDEFTFSIPNVQKVEAHQIDISGLSSCEATSTWTSKHTLFLKESSLVYSDDKTVGAWKEWGRLSKRISEVSADNSARIPQNLIDKLVLLKSQISRSKTFKFQFAHGDFTPWNSFLTCENKLGIIDWEMTKSDGVFGYDFFHFHIQNGILVSQKTTKQMYDQIVKVGLSENIFENESELKEHFRLYLLDHISYYTKLYLEQKKWHVQISWQLRAWIDLLNEVITIWNDRKLFISDFVDFLKNKNYAGLKLKSGRLEELNEYSDLDILMEKKDIKEAVRWIKKRVNVEKVIIQSQSFMKTLTVLFPDGSRLNLDLISQLKRKSKVFIDSKEILENSKFNDFGIRDCNAKDTSTYIAMFYSLNDSQIPKKYKKYADNILPIHTNLDQYLYRAYCNDTSSELKKYVKHLPVNRGISGLKNKMLYFSDIIRKVFNQSGMIITFSGVDGAGKSTIIEEIKKEFDKKYRKPVVVLRHRPSLIPILSSIKYGKVGAEQKSMETLPRQGVNKSFLNSLLRFLYYYSDYFFGQFYVWIKYVMRGYVVIYDRYYYDIINDGKRSNILLPRFITKFGFLFLLKPKYNFFLYAKADIILDRKQELDRKTIQRLTLRYKSLFARLQKRSIQTKYVSINNEVIRDTTQQIFQSIGQIK